MLVWWAQVQPTLPDPSAFEQYGPIGIACSVAVAFSIMVWLARERDAREHKQEIRDLNTENRAMGEKVLGSLITVGQALPDVLAALRDVRAERIDRSTIEAELKAISRKLDRRGRQT